MSKKLESGTLAVLAGLALAISALDLSGALDGASWLKGRVPVLTLLAVGVIITHIAVVSWNSGKEMEKLTQLIAGEMREAVNGVKFREIADTASYYRCIVDLILNARTSIDDLTWGVVSPAQTSIATTRAYEAYTNAVVQACGGRGNRSTLVYREIMSFPDGARIGKVKKLFDRNLPNYHLRFFDYSHQGTPPLLQFFVFDGVEVLVAVMATTSFENRYFRIEGAAIAQLFRSYFELAWRQGIVLKDSHQVRRNLLREIELRVGDGISDSSMGGPDPH
ncbi:hypothetical protein ACFYTQ_01000 [Nocardia sp. NPDC004068]|uniref:hypothetical protein n=1 Tax=Nocardia sp. NPDC004068 TaxID=3364303 RepID=UPI0036C72C00